MKKFSLKYSPYFPLVKNAAVGVFLFGISLLLFKMNTTLISKNHKVMKLINNRESITEHFNHLKATENTMAGFFISIEKNENLERLLSDHLNQVITHLGDHGLRIDSYESEKTNEDGFVVFKINLKITGIFFQLVGGLAGLKEQAPYIYATQYELKNSGSKWIRMELDLEIPAEVQE